MICPMCRKEDGHYKHCPIVQVHPRHEKQDEEQHVPIYDKDTDSARLRLGFAMMSDYYAD